ncbi:MAG: serine protease [Myxococcales bacterium]
MSGTIRGAVAGSIAALWLLTSCHAASSPAPRYAESGPPRYQIACSAGSDCNESVALLVGLSGSSDPVRCTAALVGPRTAITAGHCVAWELSMGNRCHDVWLGFAPSGDQPARWVGCQRITAVSEPQESWLAPDYAVLELESEVPRPPIPMGEGDVTAGEIVRMVSVTADRFYDDFHQVHTRRCVVEDRTRRPFAVLGAPPSVRVLSSCPIREGSSGAPVLDRQGRLRGLIHAGGPRYFALGVMTLMPQPVEHGDR